MRREQAEEGFADAIAEKHVAGLLGMGRINVRAEAVAANFLKRAGEAAGVAGELDRGGICEKLALAAGGGLNETAKEHANPTEKQEGQAEQRGGSPVAA